MIPSDPGFSITLDGLLKVWQLIGAPLVVAVFVYVRDISKQLRLMNGRIITLETSTKANEKTTRRELDQIQTKLHEYRSGSGDG